MMAEELGKIKKPEAGDIASQRKLYVVPLVYSLPGAPDGYRARMEAYWTAVDSHVASLEARAGVVKKVFHEGISYGGAPGIDQLKQTNLPAYPLINARLQGGATLEALEDDELFLEALDWGRLLQAGFASRKVADAVQESYNSATESRLSHIVKTLDERLGAGEAGILIASSMRGVTTPADIEIFNVMPPELDQLNRWIEEQARLQQSEMERAAAAAQSGQAAPPTSAPDQPPSDDGPALWVPGSR
jgi:hypothetical protein